MKEENEEENVRDEQCKRSRDRERERRKERKERPSEGDTDKKKIKQVSCHEKLMVTSIKVFAFTSKMSRYE